MGSLSIITGLFQLIKYKRRRMSAFPDLGRHCLVADPNLPVPFPAHARPEKHSPEGRANSRTENIRRIGARRFARFRRRLKPFLQTAELIERLKHNTKKPPTCTGRRLFKARRKSYSTTFVTEPAPTVRPPSRIANRVPSSMAIGAISSTSRVTLSPGITISVPSGSLTTPVTSVVRK